MTDSQLTVAVDAVDERRAQAVAVLEQLLRAMDVQATLETKDLPDGSISIAVTPTVELAGVVSGRRSPVGDALQYLVNKLVNKPGQERRWVAIGLGGHPEPRGQKQPRPAPTPPPAVTNGSAAPAPAPRAAAAPRPAAPVRSQDGDERTLVTDEDPVFEAAARALAERSASSGRIYAVVALGSTERGRLLRGADSVEGVSARAEGEGRLRRVVLTPDKVVPMPRQRLPVDDLPEDD